MSELDKNDCIGTTVDPFEGIVEKEENPRRGFGVNFLVSVGGNSLVTESSD